MNLCLFKISLIETESSQWPYLQPQSSTWWSQLQQGECVQHLHPPPTHLCLSHCPRHHRLSLGHRVYLHGKPGDRHSPINFLCILVLYGSKLRVFVILKGISFFVHMYLPYKDLRFSNKALALGSFEHWCDILDADLAIVGKNMFVLTMAHKDKQKAVCIWMISLRSWWDIRSFVKLATENWAPIVVITGNLVCAYLHLLSLGFLSVSNYRKISLQSPDPWVLKRNESWLIMQ